jgi:hypothetical protein
MQLSKRDMAGFKRYKVGWKRSSVEVARLDGK